MTANTAAEHLAMTLDAAARRGEDWPCRGRDEWTDEDRDTRAAAARACLGCPVSALCAAAAAELAPRWGVWAGIDYEPRKHTPRKGRRHD